MRTLRKLFDVAQGGCLRPPPRRRRHPDDPFEGVRKRRLRVVANFERDVGDYADSIRVTAAPQPGCASWRGIAWAAARGTVRITRAVPSAIGPVRPQDRRRSIRGRATIQKTTAIQETS